MLVIEDQWLATQEITKNVKNVKKSAKYFLPTPCFSAKTPQKRPLFSVSTKLQRAFWSIRCYGRGNCIDS